MPTRELHDTGALQRAWLEYKLTPAYAHALHHARNSENPEGLLWGLFETGWAYGAAHARAERQQEKSNG